jgi:hypothetical protein
MKPSAGETSEVPTNFRGAVLSLRPAMSPPDCSVSGIAPAAAARSGGRALAPMRRRRREGGAIDLSTALWASLVGLGIYFGMMYAPPYVESYEVKQMLRAVGNLAVHQVDDEALKREVLTRARAIGSHHEIRDGQEMNLPGIVLLDEDVLVNRDAAAKTIILQVRYTKHLTYPFTQRQTGLSFEPAVKVDISEVKW